MAAFLLVCVLLVLAVYAAYRSLSVVSKPWRARVVKDDDNYHSGTKVKSTVSVVLQKRFTYEAGFYGRNRIIVKSGIPVTPNTDEFIASMQVHIKDAEERAKALSAINFNSKRRILRKIKRNTP